MSTDTKARETLLTPEQLAAIFGYYADTRPDDHLSVGSHMTVLRKHVSTLTSQNAALVRAINDAIQQLDDDQNYAGLLADLSAAIALARGAP